MLLLFFLFVVFALSTAAAPPPPKVLHTGQPPKSPSSASPNTAASFESWLGHADQEDLYSLVAQGYQQHETSEKTGVHFPPPSHQQPRSDPYAHQAHNPRHMRGDYELNGHPQSYSEPSQSADAQFDLQGHLDVADHYQQAPEHLGLQASRYYQQLSQLHQQYSQVQPGTRGGPAGFYGSFSEGEAHGQIDPQLHQRFQQHDPPQIGIHGRPGNFYCSNSDNARFQSHHRHRQLNPLGDGGRNAHLPAPSSENLALFDQRLCGHGRDHEKRPLECHERDRKGKGKAKEGLRRHSQSQSSPPTKTPDQPVYEASANQHFSLMSLNESTFGPHQDSSEIDELIEKRLRYLKNSDAYQRRECGLPDEQDHAFLFRLRELRDNRPFDGREPSNPKTEAEFEEKRMEAVELVEVARDLIEKADLPPEVLKVCWRVVRASKSAKGSVQKMSDVAQSDSYAKTRAARGLPGIIGLKRMEEILFGRPITSQDSHERGRTPGNVLDLALKRLKNNEPLILEEARGELMSICTRLISGREKHLRKKRRWTRRYRSRVSGSSTTATE